MRLRGILLVVAALALTGAQCDITAQIPVPESDATAPATGVSMFDPQGTERAAPVEIPVNAYPGKWTVAASARDDQSGVRVLRIRVSKATTTCTQSGCSSQTEISYLPSSVQRPAAAVGEYVNKVVITGEAVDLKPWLPIPATDTKVDTRIELSTQAQNYLGAWSSSAAVAFTYSAGSVPSCPGGGTPMVTLNRPPSSDGDFVGSLNGVPANCPARVQSVKAVLHFVNHPETWPYQNVEISHAGIGPVTIANRDTDTKSFTGVHPRGQWLAVWKGQLALRPDFITLDVMWKP